MVNEFPQAQMPGEGGRQEQTGIGHQAVIVKDDTDTVGRRQNSNFTRFTSLLETSLFDEEGIRYTLPDHVYAEESGKW